MTLNVATSKVEFYWYKCLLIARSDDINHDITYSAVIANHISNHKKTSVKLASDSEASYYEASESIWCQLHVGHRSCHLISSRVSSRFSFVRFFKGNWPYFDGTGHLGDKSSTFSSPCFIIHHPRYWKNRVMSELGSHVQYSYRTYIWRVFKIWCHQDYHIVLLEPKEKLSDLFRCISSARSWLEILDAKRSHHVPITSLDNQLLLSYNATYDGVIKWKYFPRYWPFVRRIDQSPVNSPHKGQWRGALVFFLIYAWTNGWVNNRDAGDLRRHRAHYDVIVTIMAPERYIHGSA